jgi:hypothetical protein
LSRKFVRRVFSVVCCPAFELRHGRFSAPEIGSYCLFNKPSRIVLGRDVKFLRGTMIYSDSERGVELDDRVSICNYSILNTAGGYISIGKDSLVGDFCNLFGQGGLEIGATS